MNTTPLRGDCSQAAPTRISRGSFAKHSGRRWAGWLVVGATALAGCANLSTQLLPFSSKTGDTETKLAYARLMERHGQSVQAEQLYKQMIKQDQRQQVAYQRLGVLAAKRGQFTEASDYFQRAARAAPITPELYNDIGYNYYLQDRLEEAEKSYRQALEKNPQYAAAHNNLGLTLGQQRRYEESMAEFRHGGPEAQAYTNMAYLYAQNRELTKAKQSFSRALDLDPSLKPAAEGLIQLATITGEVPPSRNKPSKNDRQVAGQDGKPSSPSAMHKVSHNRPPAKTPADAGAPDAVAKSGSAAKTPPGPPAAVADGTKADGDKAIAAPSLLPTNVEPFSWKQPEQTASTAKPAAKEVASQDTKNSRTGQELIHDWQEHGNRPARSDDKPAATARSIEVSVQDRPARRTARTASKTAPGSAHPPSSAQLSAVRQAPAANVQTSSRAAKKQAAPRELATAQQEPQLISASVVAPEVASTRSARASQPVWLTRLVSRWTALPTVQSARIEATLAESRAAAHTSSRVATAEHAPINRVSSRHWAGPNLVFRSGQASDSSTQIPRQATPVAIATDIVDDSKCSGGPIARLPAPPAPAHSPSPTAEADPEQDTASPEPKVALQQPRSTDPAMHSSRRPLGAPSSVPNKTQSSPTANEPAKQRPQVKMAEVTVPPENYPAPVAQTPSQLTPSAPSLPRILGDFGKVPVTTDDDRIALPIGIATLRPEISQLSQNVSAPMSTNLQVQPQVMSMPTTLIRRAGESLAATSAGQSPPVAGAPQVAAQPTKQAEPQAAAQADSATAKPVVDPFAAAARANSQPGGMPAASAGAPSQSAPAVDQASQKMPQNTEQAASPVLLIGATEPQAQVRLIAAPSGQPTLAAPAVAAQQPQPLPTTPEQFVERAATQFEHHEIDQSLASYDRALEQSPSYMAALVGRAKVYRHLGRFDESLADTTRLIRTYPENAEGFLERGRTRAAMGLVPEAAEDFNMAVQLDRHNAAAWLERGKSRLMMRDFATALADYSEAVRLAPGMTRGYIERARVQRLLGQPHDALDDYTAAIRLEGQAVDGLLERALLYLELNQVQKSLADLNAAIDRAPGDARVYVARARLYRHERAWREAQDDLGVAERLDPLSKPLQLEREALRVEMPKQAQASASGS